MAARDVLAQALALPLDARAEIARALLASLDGDADADHDAAWAEEIIRRADDVARGRVTLEDWPSLRRRLVGRQ